MISPVRAPAQSEQIFVVGLQVKPFVLPMCIFIATILGLIYQQNSSYSAQPAGAPPKK
jgi:hypothetical protein